LTRAVAGDWARYAVGVGCVVAAAILFALHTPHAVNNMNATVTANAYLTDARSRTLTSGDMLGIPFDLQDEALNLIPKSSDYALLLPKDVDAASGFGIQSVTYYTIGPFLHYLLLPARWADPIVARYVICWHCDTKAWDRRTTWLWKTDQGEAIGQVRGR
jgi:hypothetical protein